MDRITARLQELETAQIVEIIHAAAARADEEGDIVLEKALMVLELRDDMPEAEFIAICDKLAA